MCFQLCSYLEMEISALQVPKKQIKQFSNRILWVQLSNASLRWKNKGIQRYDDIACGQCLQIYILFYDIWYTS